MNYAIRKDVPEMQDLWNNLQTKYRNRTISKTVMEWYKKLGKTLKLLSTNPRHPSLKTQNIEPLTKRYGVKVWRSYLENKKSGARRIFWVTLLDMV